MDEVVGSLVKEPDLEGVKYWMTDRCKSKEDVTDIIFEDEDVVSVVLFAMVPGLEVVGSYLTTSQV